jgi:hypothetical protein
MYHGGCDADAMPNIPTGSTELDDSSSNCSYSDEDSSEDCSKPHGESGRILSSPIPGILWPGIHISPDLFAGNHTHLAVLRAWYCYERVRGLIYSSTPETLSTILKEAEPLFYSD